MVGRHLSSLLCLLLLATGVAYAASPEPTERDLAQLKQLQQPNSWFESNLKGPPEVVDGRKLHPKFQWFLENHGRNPGPRQEQLKRWSNDAEYRAQVRTGVDRNWAYRTKITEEMASTEDRTIESGGEQLALRIYVPRIDEKKKLPVLVYFHGGGWLFGSLDGADRAVRLIANEAKVIVVSANYRLAPEHKLPAPQDDALNVVRWVRKNAASFGADPAQLGVGGDSAGGEMALSVALRLRAAKQKLPSALLLYYPVTDMVRMDWHSFESFGSGYTLDRDFMRLMSMNVFKDPRDAESPDLSPLRAKNLKGLPPTILVSAGFDLLHDQQEAMVERLRADGVKTVWKDYPSVIHGFMQYSGVIDDAETACVETARLFGAAVRGEKF
jgi:acetyl esterase